jgi:hypothetical protein
MAVRLYPLRNPVIRAHAERRAREAVLDMVAMMLVRKFGVPSDVAKAKLECLDRDGIKVAALRMFKASTFEDVFLLKQAPVA